MADPPGQSLDILPTTSHEEQFSGPPLVQANIMLMLCLSPSQASVDMPVPLNPLPKHINPETLSLSIWFPRL